MAAANGYRFHSTGKPLHIDGSQPIHITAIANLAIGVVAPALDATSISQRTGGFGACTDCDNAACKTNHINRRWPVNCGAIAKLTEVIVPPTLDPARFHQSACMSTACADRSNSTGKTVHIDGSQPACSSTIPDLAKTVISPALDSPCTGQSATMKGLRKLTAHSNSKHTAPQSRHINGSKSMCCGAITDLPTIVASPALDTTCTSAGTAVNHSCANRNGLTV